MAEYIERDALLAEYDRVHIGKPGGARKLIEEAVAADVVEVVRCKDCKHWRKGTFQAGNDIEHMEYGGMCPNGRFARYESDFCSYGERRSDNGRMQL